MHSPSSIAAHEDIMFINKNSCRHPMLFGVRQDKMVNTLDSHVNVLPHILQQKTQLLTEIYFLSFEEVLQNRTVVSFVYVYFAIVKNTRNLILMNLDAYRSISKQLSKNIASQIG